jgi:hypothetical protein
MFNSISGICFSFPHKTPAFQKRTARARKFASRWHGGLAHFQSFFAGLMVVRPYQIYHLTCICTPRFTLVYKSTKSTTLSRLVFVQLQCWTYSRMGMRKRRLALLCRTVCGLHTYSISSREYGLQSMKAVGSLSVTWPILPPWLPSTGHLEAVPALRPLARGNAGSLPEYLPFLKN